MHSYAGNGPTGTGSPLVARDRGNSQRSPLLRLEGGPASVDDILRLQREVGNGRVQTLLQRNGSASTTKRESSPPISAGLDFEVGAWSAKEGPRLLDFASGQEQIRFLFQLPAEATGNWSATSASPGTPKGWRIGFIQNNVRFESSNVYRFLPDREMALDKWLSTHDCFTVSFEIGDQTLDVSEHGPPWYHPATTENLDADSVSGTVSWNDAPRQDALLRRSFKGREGILQMASGRISFQLWLAAIHGTTGQIAYLRSVHWYGAYSGVFDLERPDFHKGRPPGTLTAGSGFTALSGKEGYPGSSEFRVGAE